MPPPQGRRRSKRRSTPVSDPAAAMASSSMIDVYALSNQSPGRRHSTAHSQNNIFAAIRNQSDPEQDESQTSDELVSSRFRYEHDDSDIYENDNEHAVHSSDGGTDMCQHRRDYNDGDGEGDEPLRDDDEHEHEHLHDDDVVDEEIRRSPEASRSSARANGLFGGLAGALGSVLFEPMGDSLGFSSGAKSILSALQQRDDPFLVMTALEELADLLLVVCEGTIPFPSDAFATELVRVIADAMFENSPEVILLAFRNIGSLVAEFPSAVSAAVQEGLIPLLCQRLLDVQYIDLAEEAVSTLKHISAEAPKSVTQQGGFTAALTFFDFFSIHVQRTALGIAEDCCKSISKSSYPQMKESLPTLEPILVNFDTKVSESACTCICKIVEHFASAGPEYVSSISPSLIAKLMAKLSPDVTTSDSLRYQLLKTLAVVARHSTKLACVLVNENIGDLVYQLLTRHAPYYSDTDSHEMRKDSNTIVQSLINAEKYSIITVLSVISEILPGTHASSRPQLDRESVDYSNDDEDEDDDEDDDDDDVDDDDEDDDGSQEDDSEEEEDAADCDDEYGRHSDAHMRKHNVDFDHSTAQDRTDALMECPDKLERFLKVCCELLIDIYSASVEPSLRSRVLSLLQKIIEGISDANILRAVLHNVSLTPVLTSILFLQDSKSEMRIALGICTALLENLHSTYRSGLARAGVISQIKVISEGDDRVLASYAQETLAAFGASNESVEESQTIQELKNLANNLHDRHEVRDTLKILASKLSSVSSFELLSTDIYSELLQLLSEGGKEDFISAFQYEHFANLVEKLQQTLSQSEGFEVRTLGIGDVKSASTSLTRQLRLRLVAETPEDVPASYQEFEVNVQAIATFKIIQEFLKSRFAFSRLFKSGAGLDESNDKAVIESDDEEQLTDEEEEEVEGEDIVRRSADDDSDEMEVDDDNQDHVMNDGNTDERANEEQGTATSDNKFDPRRSESAFQGVLRRWAAQGGPARNIFSDFKNGQNDNGYIFSVNGQDVAHDDIVFGAVYRNTQNAEELLSRFWSMTFVVKYRRAPVGYVHKSAEQPVYSPLVSKAVIEKNSMFSVAVKLLKELYEVGFGVGSEPKLSSELSSMFINSKLTAKLNRQLDEPVVVASGIMPDWVTAILFNFFFLFPLESRLLHLQSTSFGYSRNMPRWSQEGHWRNSSSSSAQQFQRPMGRPMRQKVRISRRSIMQNVMKVMEKCGSSPYTLEVEFYNEEGTGLGPTLEFYSLASKAFCKRKYKLWMDTHSNHPSTLGGIEDSDSYFYSAKGLFPRPLSEHELNSSGGRKQLHLFKLLGTFCARAMIDSRITDISLNPVFFYVSRKLSSGEEGSKWATLDLLQQIDEGLAQSLRKLSTYDSSTLEAIGLDFTLPGYSEFELVPSGASVMVTEDNVEEYVDRVVETILFSGVEAQISKFVEGFSVVIPYADLGLFSPNELSGMFGEGQENWSVDALTEAIKADHGYSKSSVAVSDLIELLASFDKSQRKNFLQFMTGAPNLPVGGFRALKPQFTIVRKEPEAPLHSDDYLPSVMTCANYLKLPEYSSKEVMKKQLLKAVYDGAGSFLLS